MKIVKGIVWQFFVVCACSFFLVGCESVYPISEKAPSLILKKPEHRTLLLGETVDFPAGVYAPDFNTQEGTYYLAPTKIIVNLFGMSRPRRGGLFVPAQYEDDDRQGAWLDQEEDSGGLFGAGVTSTTRIWRFKEPIPFVILQPEGVAVETVTTNQPVFAPVHVVPVPLSPPITSKNLGF